MNLTLGSNPIRIGVSNQGETEVALKGGVMTKVVTQDTPVGVVKVTRKVVELINELSEVRSTYNSAKARVEELRKAIFAVTGKADLTLTHNTIEVARIKGQTKMVVDLEFLKANFPEAYEASRKPQVQHNISTVTRRG